MCMHEYCTTLIKNLGVALVIKVLQDTYSYSYSWHFISCRTNRTHLQEDSCVVGALTKADLQMQTMRMTLLEFWERSQFLHDIFFKAPSWRSGFALQGMQKRYHEK